MHCARSVSTGLLLAAFLCASAPVFATAQTAAPLATVYMAADGSQLTAVPSVVSNNATTTSTIENLQAQVIALQKEVKDLRVLIQQIITANPVVNSGGPTLSLADAASELHAMVGQSGFAEAIEPVTSLPTLSLTSTSTATDLQNVRRTLVSGMNGEDVRTLQNALIQRGLLKSGLATGYFGPMTVAAVQQYQMDHQIVSSGTAATTGYGAVGPRTLKAILADQ